MRQPASVHSLRTMSLKGYEDLLITISRLGKHTLFTKGASFALWENTGMQGRKATLSRDESVADRSVFAETTEPGSSPNCLP